MVLGLDAHPRRADSGHPGAARPKSGRGSAVRAPGASVLGAHPARCIPGLDPPRRRRRLVQVTMVTGMMVVPMTAMAMAGSHLMKSSSRTATVKTVEPQIATATIIIRG